MFWYIFVAIVATASAQTDETYRAIAYLRSETITGNVTFTETEDGVRVQGWIHGLDAGNYGFHVHELGDIGDCLATGAHYNPDDVTHGARDNEVRHVGDLGNVRFEGEGVEAVAIFDYVDSVIALRGRNSILGRSLVLHEREDDLGLTSHEDSLTTGNAGARVACGVIGILAPNGPWNSAARFVLTKSSLILILSNVLANRN
ncbi:Extracellular superoxide dismutase [Eumeta japonica]|uniref:Superoxide dismutase [Cu-Zn] n=1 Tax=Eumeta variegata TaxID=151549 RepID=A0A4C1XA58_EUMVA|nr:Extracellular superoxide dismutase [Eumeta japonica]